MSDAPDDVERERLAALFADEAVARCYYARTPYTPALYGRLLEIAPGRGRALDLGCGPGKVARVLADHFDEVVALDPSAAMIAAGKAADAGAHPNIAWAQARAEDFESAEPFDLVTAGGSVHWPDAAVVYPKLARWTPMLAVLNDAPVFPHPAPPCGMAAWIAFMNRWLPSVGRPLLEAPRDERGRPQAAPHEAWMDVEGHERFTGTYRQSVEDFVVGQHSRVTWSLPMMGAALAAAYDRDLEAMMRPFAVDGMLSLDVVSDLTWGVPLRAPRG